MNQEERRAFEWLAQTKTTPLTETELSELWSKSQFRPLFGRNLRDEEGQDCTDALA